MKQGYRIKHLIQQLYQNDQNKPLEEELKWSLDKYNSVEPKHPSLKYADETLSKYNPHNSNNHHLVFLASQNSAYINDVIKPYTQNYKSNRWFARLIYQKPNIHFKLAFSFKPEISVYKSINIMNRSLELSKTDFKRFYDTNYSNVIQSFKKSLKTITNCLKPSNIPSTTPVLKSVTYSSVDLPRFISRIDNGFVNMSFEKDICKNVEYKSVNKSSKMKTNEKLDELVRKDYNLLINKNGDILKDADISTDDSHLSWSMKDDSKLPMRSILRSGKFEDSQKDFYTRSTLPHISFAPNSELVSVFEYPAFNQYDSYSSDEYD